MSTNLEYETIETFHGPHVHLASEADIAFLRHRGHGGLKDGRTTRAVRAPCGWNMAQLLHAASRQRALPVGR